MTISVEKAPSDINFRLSLVKIHQSGILNSVDSSSFRVTIVISPLFLYFFIFHFFIFVNFCCTFKHFARCASSSVGQGIDDPVFPGRILGAGHNYSPGGHASSVWCHQMGMAATKGPQSGSYGITCSQSFQIRTVFAIFFSIQQI